MPGFRRVHLRGSDELFRSTDPAAPAKANDPAQGEVALEVEGEREPVVAAHPIATSIEGNLLRLTDDEIVALAEAIQHAKFPGKVGSRPSLDNFERLEELRQKLLALL